MAKSRGLKGKLSIALLLGAIASTGASAATLSLVPSTTTPTVGSTVSFNVMVSGAVDLYGFQYSLSFNPAVFQAASSTEGPFLATGGNTAFGAGTVNNTAGTISFVYDTLLGPVAGVNGSGVLERLTFTARAAGTSTFAFSDVILVNSTNGDIPTTASPLTLTVSAVPEPATLALLGLGVAGLLAVRRKGGAGEAATA